MTHVVDNRPAAPVGDQSTADLVQRASEQMTKLVRDELALARAELTEKGKHAGVGVGLFGGGGVVALYGVGALIASLIMLLALAMPGWVAALIVAVVLFGTAAVLAVVGRNQVRQANPPQPEQAVSNMRADVDTVKAAVRERGR
jgi:uncharacterized membrane protein YqjE